MDLGVGAQCDDGQMPTETLCACGCEKSLPRPGARFLPGHHNAKVPVGTACAVEACDRPHEFKGYCHAHHEWMRRNPGRVPTEAIRTRDPIQRFLAKVTKLDSGHWIWTGSTSSEGRYGSFHLGRVMPAHRAAWILFRGAIDADLTDVDHRCRKTLCVNPEHLEPVTHRENVLRGDAPPAANAARTHCTHGHEFTPENTRRNSKGHRACVACEKSPEGLARAREKTRRYRARQKALAAS